MNKKNVVIAGGGTGGHIYPGLALAERLKVTHPNVQVHFVGAIGGLEESIVPKYGYPLHLLPIDRLHASVGIKRRLKTLLGLPWALLKAAVIQIKLRPMWVLGVGGFASGPFVLMASLFGVKSALFEPNAYPGMANRYLARFVKYCFLVFSETGQYFPAKKTRTVGLPVRFSKMKKKNYYESGQLKVLVFGGSQGARAINNTIGDWVEEFPKLNGTVKVIHQVGQKNYTHWQERYGSKYESFLTFVPYIDDMPEKLAWADLVICRAGIGTVAEVAMSCTPAIFVPLPTAADNHQQKNAETLVHKDSAIMCLEKDFSAQKLNFIVENLIEKPDALKNISQALETIDYSQAADKILHELMGEKS